MRVCKRAVTLLLLLLWCLSVAASAAVTTDYVLDDGEKRPIPRPYVPVRTLSVTASTGRSLNAPQDLFLAPSGDLVVADTGNHRVLVLSPSGEVKREITEAGGLPLSKPQGVFVDELGHLFIADSSNARIVHLSPDGTFIEAFGKPETGYLTSIDLYTPTKVLFSASTGYLYTIMGKELLTLNANNEFKGYFAANQLGFSLKNRLIQMFATEEQKKRLRKPEPVSFQNIHYQDARFFPMLLSIAKDTLINTPLIVVFALFIATLLSKDIRGKGLFRSVFFLPVILGTGFVMQQLLGVQMNADAVEVARGILLPEKVVRFLNPGVTQVILEFLSRVTLVLWKSGVQIIIFLAGLQAIPRSFYEAARVDAATEWECFWFISLPMMAPTLLLGAVYTIVAGFLDTSNEMLGYIHELGFQWSQFEYASAVSWLYFLFVILVLAALFLLLNPATKRVREG